MLSALWLSKGYYPRYINNDMYALMTITEAAGSRQQSAVRYDVLTYHSIGITRSTLPNVPSPKQSTTSSVIIHTHHTKESNT